MLLLHHPLFNGGVDALHEDRSFDLPSNSTPYEDEDTPSSDGPRSTIPHEPGERVNHSNERKDEYLDTNDSREEEEEEYLDASGSQGEEYAEDDFYEEEEKEEEKSNSTTPLVEMVYRASSSVSTPVTRSSAQQERGSHKPSPSSHPIEDSKNKGSKNEGSPFSLREKISNRVNSIRIEREKSIKRDDGNDDENKPLESFVCNPRNIRCNPGYFHSKFCGFKMLLPEDVRCQKMIRKTTKIPESFDSSSSSSSSSSSTSFYSYLENNLFENTLSHAQDSTVGYKGKQTDQNLENERGEETLRARRENRETLRGEEEDEDEEENEENENNKPVWWCKAKERWISEIHFDEKKKECVVYLSESLERFFLTIVSVFILCLFVILIIVCACCIPIVTHNNNKGGVIINNFLNASSSNPAFPLQTVVIHEGISPGVGGANSKKKKKFSKPKTENKKKIS